MNPRNLHFMAACCRDASAREADPIRREALENLAAYADRSAEARHAVKAVLAIYDAFPDAELVGVNTMAPLPMACVECGPDKSYLYSPADGKCYSCGKGIA